MVVVPRREEGTGSDELAVGGTPAVLLIDRQPLFLAALATLLTSPPVNATVRYTSSTEEGLAIARSGRFHVVFCEVKAEPLTAVELADSLAGLQPPVPLILLGEPDDEGLLASALHTSVAGMFTKDATLDEFLAGVNAVLAGHRAVGSRLMSRVLLRLTDVTVPQRRNASQLSPTERDILAMIGDAKSIPFIAETRGITNKTVRNHLANIYRKLELRSRTEAMLWAARMGLTSS